MLKRLATMAVAGALAGLPLASAASAAPGTDVTFTSAGVRGWLCDSKPSVPRLTVREGTSIGLTNGLGATAQLNIDGTPSATVDDGETVQVQIHRGPVSITMVQSCVTPTNAKALTVAVQPAKPASEETRPPRAAPNGSDPDAASSPPDAGGARFPGDPGGGAAGITLPQGDSLGMPPAVVVGADGSERRRLAAGAPLDKGPVGLLAIIATVCVIGVATGAIRAIITQRAARAKFA